MTISSPLRLAVAGCGSIGRRHLANLRCLSADCPTEIILYDVSEPSRENAARDFGGLAVRSLKELWAMRPDAVLICTPSHLHTQNALCGARVGASLFIEKPIAHNLAGLSELECLVTEHSLTTLVGCNMRFHPGPAQIKRWLDESLIGDILSARLVTGSYLPAWRPQQDYRESYSASIEYGGAVLDCIHELDLALWLLGPAALHSALVRPASALGLQTDGLAELLLTHKSGAISSVHLNFVQRNYRRSIEIIGSEGTLAWDFQEGTVVHFGRDGKVVQSAQQPAEWNVNQMYLDELAYFLCCLQSHMPSFNPVSDAVQTLRIALQARQQGAAQ